MEEAKTWMKRIVKKVYNQPYTLEETRINYN